MKHRVWHIIGNGDMAHLYQEKKRVGNKLICNQPPFEISPSEIFATCMVDFKMMAALTEGSITIDAYRWVLGTRPRIWMYERPDFYLKYAPNVREFYTHVPDYAYNATNFNCGHMATHYAASRHKADEIHLYGCDTVFDFNMRSVTDFYLSSDRTDTNNYRLLNTWRPVWRDIIREHPQTKFIFHHNHDALKIPLLDNMEVIVYNKPLSTIQNKKDTSDISDGRGMEKQKITGNSIEYTKKQSILAGKFARRGYKNHEL